MACSPAMTFHVGRSDSPGRYLLRGDSEGQIVMWTLPEVTERQMTLVRQESFDRLPGTFCENSRILVLQGCFCYPNGIVCDDCLLKTHSNIQVNLMSSIILLQEIFICLALPPRCSTSLADIWENLHHPPAGIIDGLVCRLYNILVLYLYLWSGFCIITTVHKL